MVTKKPKGLGLGLEALLGPKVTDTPRPAGNASPSSLKLGHNAAGSGNSCRCNDPAPRSHSIRMSVAPSGSMGRQFDGSVYFGSDGSTTS